MQRSLFIHATNVHQGGGRSLLAAIIKALPIGMKSILCLDSRMPSLEGMSQEVQVRRVEPSMLQRFGAERWLAKNVTYGDIVLCFGNLPPLFKLRGHSVIFVQNRYLVDDVELGGFSLRTRLRLTVERFWLSSRKKNVDEFIVQTPSMKCLLEARTNGGIPVRVLPFMTNHVGCARRGRIIAMQGNKKFDFLYVASGEPHKNHRQLIEAWCLLAKENLFPSLKLTVDSAHFAEVCSWMEQQVGKYQLNVENSGSVPPDQIKRLYEQARALIYPSTFESFGLPLIEARQAGLSVLASELDYVRDVLDPEQTFDPNSTVSIARAVKRFMGIEEESLPLQDATGFIEYLLGQGK